MAEREDDATGKKASKHEGYDGDQMVAGAWGDIELGLKTNSIVVSRPREDDTREVALYPLNEAA